MYTPLASSETQLSDDPATRCRQVLTVQRVINFALFMGPLIITIVFAVLLYGFMDGAVLAGGFPDLVPGLPVLTFLGLVVAVVAVAAAYALPGRVAAGSIARLAPVSLSTIDRVAED